MQLKQNFLSFYLVILSFMFIPFSGLLAQESSGQIRGHVYDIATGEPIIFANVVLDGTNYGENTDESGLFTLTGVPVGSYDLRVSYIGYEDQVTPVEVSSRKINYYKVEIAAGGVQLGVVDISAERQQAKTEVRISKIQVSQKQIKALPSTGGDADIVQYLQILPGVISTGDQGGQLYIRGGSPVQNKILLDGLTIYNPFHSIGFYSAFETELIRNVDVLTGGFNAEYGGRISAVVNINTREGNKKRLAGQVSVSPFMAKAIIEAPLTKPGSGGDLTMILTSKRSLIGTTSKSLYSYAAEVDSIGLPFGFQDTYGKISYVTSNGSKFNFFGFNFDDQYKNPQVSEIEWNNKGGGLTFDLLPNASALTLDGIIGYTQYEVGIVETEGDPRSSLIREYDLGLDFKYLTNEASIKYGVDIKSIKTIFDFTNPFGLKLSEEQNTTEISGFLTYRRAWDNLVIEPGFRLQYYASLAEFYPEPRLGIKWNITDKTRLKVGAGYYSQNIISTSNERDVVNLFNGFLTGPEKQFQDLNGNRVTSKLQKARHLLAGIEQDVSSSLQINVEAYVKDFFQLVVINRNKTTPGQADFTTETGQAYGIDFSAKYEIPKWYFWATYSYGFVNRFDGEQTFPTVFDRRHNANFLATYSFGAKNDILLSLRWNLGSGFPFTKTQAFYDNIPFREGPNTAYETDNQDRVGIIYSETRNGGRLPYYHRLDLSAQKTFHLSDRFNVEVVASVTNAYDRANIFYFDRIKYDRVNQLPIMPSVSAKFNF